MTSDAEPPDSQRTIVGHNRVAAGLSSVTAFAEPYAIGRPERGEP